MQGGGEVHKLRTSEFIPLAEQLNKDKKSYIAIFKGGISEEGVSWCSDCVVAEPVISGTILPHAAKIGLPVYIVDVGDRAEWKDPQNPLRVHASIKVNCVPTILKFKDGVVFERLKEEEVLDKDLVTAMLDE